MLVIILIAGAMPGLFDITINPRCGGPAISLDICHPPQSLDITAAVPMAAPSRIEDRVAAPALGTPASYQVRLVTDYLPDIDPPPPR